MTGASEAICESRLREIAASDNLGFVALVRLAGLNPGRDFRYADLSGADLRGQDLRAFDFTGAKLDGARIVGARLPRVSGAQRRTMVQAGRAMTVLVGERLLADETQIAARVGQDVFLPRAVNEALRRSEADTQLRTRRTGAHIGDNSDLVRRRINGALKASPLPRHPATLVLAEPETDFDFDALSAIVARFEQAGQRPFVFLLPHVMAVEESGEKIVRARLANLAASNVMAFLPELDRRGAHLRKPERVAAQGVADRALVLDFVVAAASFQPCGPPVMGRFPGMKAQIAPFLGRGARKARETLAASIARTLATRPTDYSGRTRRIIMVREDLLDPEEAGKVVHALKPVAGVCHIGSFTGGPQDPAEHYVVDAKPESNLWGVFGVR